MPKVEPKKPGLKRLRKHSQKNQEQENNDLNSKNSSKMVLRDSDCLYKLDDSESEYDDELYSKGDEDEEYIPDEADLGTKRNKTRKQYIKDDRRVKIKNKYFDDLYQDDDFGKQEIRVDRSLKVEVEQEEQQDLTKLKFYKRVKGSEDEVFGDDEAKEKQENNESNEKNEQVKENCELEKKEACDEEMEDELEIIYPNSKSADTKLTNSEKKDPNEQNKYSFYDNQSLK